MKQYTVKFCQVMGHNLTHNSFFTIQQTIKQYIQTFRSSGYTNIIK